MAQAVYSICQAAVIIAALYFVWSCEMKRDEYNYEIDKIKATTPSVEKSGE